MTDSAASEAMPDATPTAPLPDAPDGRTEAASGPHGAPEPPDAIGAAFAPLRELAGVLLADGIARQQAAHAIGRLVADAEARIRGAQPAAPAQIAQAFRAGQQAQAAQQAADESAQYDTID